MMDKEFEPIRANLLDLGIVLNTVSNDKHIPEIKRFICTIKERTRSVYNTLPFTKMPAQMIIEMVHASIFWLNMFPVTDGVSNDLSPHGIIVGLKLE